MERIMGYARVSSTGQNLERQLIELRKYVSEEHIIVDKVSGKSLHRPPKAARGNLGCKNEGQIFRKTKNTRA